MRNQLNFLVGTEDEYSEYLQGYGELETVQAFDRQQAAETFSENHDRKSGDYYIASNSPTRIVVIDLLDSALQPHWYSVYTESIPEYTAAKEAK